MTTITAEAVYRALDGAIAKLGEQGAAGPELARAFSRALDRLWPALSVEVQDKITPTWTRRYFREGQWRRIGDPR
jgi:hypothetical protein